MGKHGRRPEERERPLRQGECRRRGFATRCASRRCCATTLQLPATALMPRNVSSLDTLVTLPEKVDLCCAVAALAAKAPSPIDKDARLSSSGVATDPEFSLLQCHECTGKVEAHGSSAPFVARRQVSHATELVRRAISFVLDDAAAEDDILTQPSIWDAAPHVRFNAINAAASAA